MKDYYLSYRLREARAKDKDAIKALVFGVLSEYGLEPDGGTTDADLEDIRLHYTSNGGYFGVLLDEHSQIVGTAGLYRMTDDMNIHRTHNNGLICN